MGSGAGQQRVVDAETAYRRALQLAPDHAKAWNNLGVLLTGLRRHEEAETSFRETIRFAPEMAEAYNNLGAVLIELKRFAAAEAAYRKALELKPDYAEAAATCRRTFMNMRPCIFWPGCWKRTI